jgi:hypothetical protein
MRRWIFAAVAVLASVSIASAQGTWAPTSPSVAQATLNTPAAAAGCSTCGSTHMAGRLVSPLLIGPGCATQPGCTSFAAQRTFMFGSCNQFFNAGNKCGTGNCNGTAYGSGGLGAYDNCKGYGSYLNR